MIRLTVMNANKVRDDYFTLTLVSVTNFPSMLTYFDEDDKNSRSKVLIEISRCFDQTANSCAPSVTYSVQCKNKGEV